MTVITSIKSEGSKLEVLFKDKTVYMDGPGFMDYTESGGEAPVRAVVPATGDVGASVGRSRVPQITCNFIATPQHEFFELMRKALRSEELLTFRLQTESRETHDGGVGTAAIASDGEVTFAGGNEPGAESAAYGIGSALVIGANKYIIIRTEVAGDVTTVFTETQVAAIAAAAYTIEIPALRRGPAVARVSDFDQWVLSAESEMNISLTLQPMAQMPAAVVV